MKHRYKILVAERRLNKHSLFYVGTMTAGWHAFSIWTVLNTQNEVESRGVYQD